MRRTATTTTPGPGHAGGVRWQGPRRRGFSLLELLVVVLILTVLFAILLPLISRVRRSAKAAQCLSNLHQVALGFHQYAANHGGRLPNPPSVDLSWEAVLLRHVGSAKAYQCPGDDELAATLGSSYDWRDTGDPTTTLAGRRLADASGRTVLVFDSLPNWHADGMMNAARVDGSARAMSARQCLADLMTPITEAERGN